MKKYILLLLLFCFFIQTSYSQQKIAREKYFIKANQEVLFKIKDSLVTYKKGWIITETVGGKTIQRKLSEKETKTIQIDTIIKLDKRWFVGEVKHSDDAPHKLIINPWIFKDSSGLTKLNTKGYIKIPENRYVRLKKTYFKWSAITIPFAIRPALNDSIGNKITTDLNLGASFSWNIGWETFKNSRIKVKKSSYGISFGIGTGFTKISLDKNNTSLDNDPLKNSEDGLGLFIAPGIGINIRGFQLVGFLGYDIGLTKNVKKWNYNGKPYFGIGLGIDLSTLGSL